MSTTRELFKKHDEYFLDFDAVENKRSVRRDLHGLLLLESLGVMTGYKAISGAAHDIWYPDVDMKTLDAIVTDEIVIELLQSGFHWCSDADSLAMFA